MVVKRESCLKENETVGAARNFMIEMWFQVKEESKTQIAKSPKMKLKYLKGIFPAVSAKNLYYQTTSSVLTNIPPI